MLPKQDEKIILAELGLLPNERYKAEFFMHKVFDRDASCGEAEALARIDAQEKSERLGREIMPDLSPENLKRLGAQSVFKYEPWVKIKRMGVKDYISYPVNEQHKLKFPNEWALFEAQNNESKDNQENIREGRDNLRSGEDRPIDSPQGSNWQGGVSYTPTAYTISFG